jgi:hypothetical protein
MIWGLSKPAANYRPATRTELRCAECRFMFSRLASGGCRYVRGLIQASDFCDEFVPGRGKDIPPGTLCQLNPEVELRGSSPTTRRLVDG